MTISRERLTTYFDAVVMLTWSDWHTEPRSNRYHYAMRFARSVPVLFLQRTQARQNRISIDTSEITNIDIVNCPSQMGESDAAEIKLLLATRGIKRPLLWIYDSIHYQCVLEALPTAFRVYHATEDYFTTSDISYSDDVVIESVRKILQQVDFLVAVSQKVLDVCVSEGGYLGKSLLAQNGCDYAFYEKFLLHAATDKKEAKSIVLYQGGINGRLDYELLFQVALDMPNWEFHFCGLVTKSAGWARLQSLPNVRYLGHLRPEHVAQKMCGSMVGIIPFIQGNWIRNSLPLKTYEYIACGLPVVSVPIIALEPQKDLIVFAETARDFADSIEQVAATRHDPAHLRKRQIAAQENSYDKRFEEVTAALSDAYADLQDQGRTLDVALLYDPASTHVGAIKEHLESFDRYSNHNIAYLPAANLWGVKNKLEGIGPIDLSIFDVVAVHHSIRISNNYHLNGNFAEAIERFPGFKVLFIQDEYEGTEIARAWMDRLKFDLVYTCVPIDQRESVYPAFRFPYTDFLSTLTGFVPENSELENFAKPLKDRKIYIGYRGRKLSAIYGTLGNEKYQIGIRIKSHARDRDLLVDIEVDDKHRIYGPSWYKFIGSVRATLGTESGASVFDFDGSISREIKRLEQEEPQITFEGLFKKFLWKFDGIIRMNQISPKLFEAIRLRTALILFEGEYSGVIKPDIHYIPLKKDYSNITQVFEKLNDDNYIRQITERAYLDVVKSGKYSYENFVKGFDASLSARCFRPKARKILFGALFTLDNSGEMRQILPILPIGLPYGARPLDCPMAFQQITEALVSARVKPQENSGHQAEHGPVGICRSLWRILPLSTRQKLLNGARNVLPKIISVTSKNTLTRRMARHGWKLLPRAIRTRINSFRGVS